MQYNDYYKTMGLSRNSTQDEIKRSYRKLARKYHPDVSKERDAEAKFKELGKAYEILKDLKKRAAYDKLWKTDEDSNPPHREEGFKVKGRGFTGSNISAASIPTFGKIFGQWFRRPEASRPVDQVLHGSHTRGHDIHTKIYIDLEDSIRGATRNISLATPEMYVQDEAQLHHRNLNIKIPKGIKSGQHIRLSGLGNHGSVGGEAGDLLLEIVFNKHPLYRVSESDIYLDLPVTPWEAKLGAKIKVPTPEGIVGLKIPADSRQGSKLCLKDHGLPTEIPGDFFVVLKIVLPPANTEEAKVFYQKMQQEFNFNPRLSMGV